MTFPFLHAPDPWCVPGQTRYDKLCLHILYAVSRGTSYAALAEHLGVPLSEIGLAVRGLRRAGSIVLVNGHPVVRGNFGFRHFFDPRLALIYDELAARVDPLWFRVDDLRARSSSDDEGSGFFARGSERLGLLVRYENSPLLDRGQDLRRSKWANFASAAALAGLTPVQIARLGAKAFAVNKENLLYHLADQGIAVHEHLGIPSCVEPPPAPPWVAPEGCLQECDA